MLLRQELPFLAESDEHDDRVDVLDVESAIREVARGLIPRR
jgi:hypothetical protein